MAIVTPICQGPEGAPLARSPSPGHSVPPEKGSGAWEYQRANRVVMRRAGATMVAGIVLSAALAWAAVGDGRVPFDRIPPPVQERLRGVMDHAVFQRAVHSLTFRSHEPVFLYFLDHPAFAAAVARALKVAQYRVEPRTDGTYWGDDARGATGIFEVVYADPHKRVVHAQGTYDTKWLPTVYARLVLVLDFEHRHGADGQSRVTSDLKGYLRVDNPFLNVLARLVGPIVGSAVDRKVARTFGIAAKVSEQAYDDPGGFLQVLREAADIDPGHLSALAARLGQAAGSHPDASAGTS